MADAVKPNRRLPFKPTALRQKSDPKPAPKDDDEDDDGLSLFKRSAEVFPLALAEQERRIKRKQAEREKSSQARSPERDSRPTPGASEEPGKKEDAENDESRKLGTPPSKRSRTSDESPESRTKPSPSRRDATETPSKRITRAAASRTPRKQEVIPSKPVISIDDSDDDPDEDDIYDASPIRKPRRETSEREPSPLVIEDNDDSLSEFEGSVDKPTEEEDEEYKEYILRAKERQKALEQEAAQEVYVYVTSDIPGATPRQFKFTLAKPLKILRNAWVDVHKASISATDLANVFLTWRSHELYDETTLHSLDLPTVFRRCAGDHEGFRDNGDWTNVHLHMWTRDLWDEHERQEARRRRHDLGEYSDDEWSAAHYNDDVVEVVHEEKKIKVILKTKTDEPLKTSVRPSTNIGTIVELFRKMRGLAPDARVTLMFDGEQLEEDMTVEEADIGDMETIEVYIR
ncbi:hypothetical protein CCHL11_05045 [Colletotrichum chlorophyti]|uniref:Ubiquitin-like domain-containing protein n=1 Tax=Colletotrichum chlorophyti TaxID=708187 RepID=A0A1Q8S3D9_9PEZI|nr:hypothetical protein CCHL11_05045 [Colletotrichum chlorophyti]